MDPDAMLGLVQCLSVKSRRTGPEHMAYLRGVEFAEKLFVAHRLILEKQIRELEDERDMPKSVDQDFDVASY